MPLLIPVLGSSTCEDLTKQVETAYLYGHDEEQSPTVSEPDQTPPVDDGERSQRSLINHAVGFIKSFSGQGNLAGTRPVNILVVGNALFSGVCVSSSVPPLSSPVLRLTYVMVCQLDLLSATAWCTRQCSVSFLWYAHCLSGGGLPVSEFGTFVRVYLSGCRLLLSRATEKRAKSRCQPPDERHQRKELRAAETACR